MNIITTLHVTPAPTYVAGDGIIAHFSYAFLFLCSVFFVAVAAVPVLVICDVVSHWTVAFLRMKSEPDLPILGKLSFL
jgi:hypothetical protein